MKEIPPVVWLVGAAIYVVCPLDFDFIPILGWIDDLIVAYIGISKWRQGVRPPAEVEPTTSSKPSQSSDQSSELLPPLLADFRSDDRAEAGGR